MGVTDWFQLPYPDPGDRPCDGAAAICALRDRVDQVLTAWDADVALLRQPPGAVLRWQSETPQQVKVQNDTVQFNSVDLDTGGMVDLGLRADRIYLPRPGVYAVDGYVMNNGVVESGGNFEVSIVSNAPEAPGLPWTIRTGRPNPVTGSGVDPTGEPIEVNGQIAWGQAALAADTVPPIWVSLSMPTAFQYQLVEAQLAVAWISDLPEGDV